MGGRTVATTDDHRAARRPMGMMLALLCLAGFAPATVNCFMHAGIMCRRPGGSTAQALRMTTSAAPVAATGGMIIKYHELKLETDPGISIHDITERVAGLVRESGVAEGFVNVVSRHTTTAVTMNEAEGRLMDDLRQFLLGVAPPGKPYLHNDLHLRSAPAGWPGGDEAWRRQEPLNAHSHLLSMMLGNSETVPVTGERWRAASGSRFC